MTFYYEHVINLIGFSGESNFYLNSVRHNVLEIIYYNNNNINNHSNNSSNNNNVILTADIAYSRVWWELR